MAKLCYIALVISLLLLPCDVFRLFQEFFAGDTLYGIHYLCTGSLMIFLILKCGLKPLLIEHRRNKAEREKEFFARILS
jgi:hypothetical protein